MINFSAVICSTRAPTNPVPLLCPRPSRFSLKIPFPSRFHSPLLTGKMDKDSRRFPEEHLSVGKSKSRPESKTVECERDLSGRVMAAFVKRQVEWKRACMGRLSSKFAFYRLFNVRSLIRFDLNGIFLFPFRR